MNYHHSSATLFNVFQPLQSQVSLILDISALVTDLKQAAVIISIPYYGPCL